MTSQKISALVSSASAQASTLYPVVSGGNANKSITQHTMLQSLGIPQYIEGTCKATTTVAFLPKSNVFDVYVKVLVASSAAAGGTQTEDGIGTNTTFFGSRDVSAKGLYRYDQTSFSDPANYINFSGAVVASMPHATAASSFVVGIGYFRTP